MGYADEPLWADLVNSDWRDYRGSGRREDRIDDDRWLGVFLRRTPWRDPLLPSAGEREHLRALRGLLRRMVDHLLKDEAIPEDETAALNRLLAGSPVLRRLEREGDRWRVGLEPARGDLGDVLGDVAASFAGMLACGEGDRVKLCENPDCRWVMVDSSRNRSRRWCEAEACGNLMKVRRFRQRRRRVDSRSG